MQHGQFAEFVRDRYPLLLRFAAREMMLPADHADVACLVQQALLNVMTRGGGIEGIDAPRADALCFQAIRNALRDIKRREGYHRAYLEQAPGSQADQLPVHDLEATGEELSLLQDEIRETFRSALGQLSPPELKALRAWLETGGVRSQAIQRLGLTDDEQAIRNQYDQPLFRAKRRLQQQLHTHYDQASLLGLKQMVDMLREVAAETHVS